MLKNSFFILIVLFVNVSCGTKVFKSKDELKDFISDEDNNLKYSKSINGITFVLQYKPTDLLVNQELTGNESNEKINELRLKYKKYIYFILSMSKDNKEVLTSVADDKRKFGEMVNDLAFGMDEKVHLYTQQNDTISMSDFIYPRMYGMSNDTSLMFAFPRNQKCLKNSYLNFTIADIGLVTGEIKFKIQTKPIIDEPKLDFN